MAFEKGYIPHNKKEAVVRDCAVCGASFSRRPSRQNKFCSRGCYFKSGIPAKSMKEVSQMNIGKPSHNPTGNPRMGDVMRGKKATLKQLEGLRIGWLVTGAEKTSSWQGGLTIKNWGLHRSHAYRKWAKLVKERDGECIWCGSQERLEADHIKPVALFPELLLELINGRTLCHECHKKTDTYAGRTRTLQLTI